MGVPYFRVRWGARLRALGPWRSSCLALGLGKEARERGSEGMGFHSLLQLMDEMWAGEWMSVTRQVESHVPELTQFLSKV